MRGDVRGLPWKTSQVERLIVALLREFRYHTDPANHLPLQIRPVAHPLQRTGVLIVGLLAMLLAGVGAIAPVMPVSPFALVALFCFARSSARVRRWITRSHAVKSAVSFVWSRPERPFGWVRWCAVRLGGLQVDVCR
jgi:hypothetical protein